jgi:hypothetical protein
MALIAHVISQDDLNGTTSSAIDTTGAKTIFLVVVSLSAVAEPVITDSEGNYWWQGPGQIMANGTVMRVWFCADPATSATHTFTATRTGSYPAIAVQAHSGVLSFLDALDHEDGGAGTVTSRAAGTVTPLSDDDMVLAAWGFGDAGNPTGSFAIDNGFTAVGFAANSSGNAFGIGHGYKYLSGGKDTALTPTASWSGATASDGVVFAYVTSGRSGVFVEDTFVDTDTTALQSHTGELGATWTERTAVADFTIVANSAYPPITGEAIYTASGTPASAEYDVLVQFFQRLIGVGDLSVVARFVDTDNYYIAQYTGDLTTTGNFRIYKKVGGSFTELAASGTILVGQGWPPSVRFRIRDASKKVYVDGTELLTTSDNALTAAGLAGVRGTEQAVVAAMIQAEDAGGGGGGGFQSAWARGSNVMILPGAL